MRIRFRRPKINIKLPSSLGSKKPKRQQTTAEESLQQARTFAPKIFLDPDDPYRPCSIDWYLRQVNLYRHSDAAVVSRAVTLDVLAQHSTDDYYISPKDEEVAYKGQPLSTSGGQARVAAPIYVHKRLTKNNFIDLIYILPFPFNGGQYMRGKLSGLGWRTFYWPHFAEHEFDWEFAIVRLKRDGSGVGAVWTAPHGYANGRWHEAETDVEMEGTHPILYCSAHSHALYPSAGKHSLKGMGDWMTKVAGFFEAGLEDAKAVDVIDGGGPVWEPWRRQGGVVLVGNDDGDDPFASAPWMEWEGAWGKVLDNYREIVKPHGGHLPDYRARSMRKFVKNHKDKLPEAERFGQPPAVPPQQKYWTQMPVGPLIVDWDNPLAGLGHGPTELLRTRRALFVALRGYVARLDPATGRTVGVNELAGEGHELGRMVEAGGNLILGMNGKVFCLNPARIASPPRWVNSLKGAGYGPVRLLAAHGYIYALCNGHLFAINPSDGDTEYKNSLKGFGSADGDLAVFNDKVAVGIGGRVLLIDTSLRTRSIKSNPLKGYGSGPTRVLGGPAGLYATVNGRAFFFAGGNMNVAPKVDDLAGAGHGEARLALNGGVLAVGIDGYIFGLDIGFDPSRRRTWKNELAGYGHGATNVAFTRQWLYASCNGYAFVLDGGNGQLMAVNELKGYGHEETSLAAHGLQVAVGIDGHVLSLAAAV